MTRTQINFRTPFLRSYNEGKYELHKRGLLGKWAISQNHFFSLWYGQNGIQKQPITQTHKFKWFNYTLYSLFLIPERKKNMFLPVKPQKCHLTCFYYWLMWAAKAKSPFSVPEFESNHEAPSVVVPKEQSIYSLVKGIFMKFISLFVTTLGVMNLFS